MQERLYSGALHLISGLGILTFFAIGFGIPARLASVISREPSIAQELLVNFTGAALGAALAIIGAIWVESFKRKQAAQEDLNRLLSAMHLLKDALVMLDSIHPEAPHTRIDMPVAKLDDAIETLDFMTINATIHDVDAWLAAVRIMKAWKQFKKTGDGLEIQDKVYRIRQGRDYLTIGNLRAFKTLAGEMLPIVDEALRTLKAALRS